MSTVSTAAVVGVLSLVASCTFAAPSQETVLASATCETPSGDSVRLRVLKQQTEEEGSARWTRVDLRLEAMGGPDSASNGLVWRNETRYPRALHPWPSWGAVLVCDPPGLRAHLVLIETKDSVFFSTLVFAVDLDGRDVPSEQEWTQDRVATHPKYAIDPDARVEGMTSGFSGGITRGVSAQMEGERLLVELETEFHPVYVEFTAGDGRLTLPAGEPRWSEVGPEISLAEHFAARAGIRAGDTRQIDRFLLDTDGDGEEEVFLRVRYGGSGWQAYRRTEGGLRYLGSLPLVLHQYRFDTTTGLMVTVEGTRRDRRAIVKYRIDSEGIRQIESLEAPGRRWPAADAELQIMGTWAYAVSETRLTASAEWLQGDRSGSWRVLGSRATAPPPSEFDLAVTERAGRLESDGRPEARE